MSIRGGQHCLAHTDSIQTPVKSPDCLLGEVRQPSDSRLSETGVGFVIHDTLHFPVISNLKGLYSSDVFLVQCRRRAFGETQAF